MAKNVNTTSHPNFKGVGIAVGGWSFSDEGPTRYAWSNMTRTKENRKTFVVSLGKFLEQWPFSSVELHWEWPGHQGRGGNPADTKNQLELLKDMRALYNPNLRISIVLPAQYEYLKNMDPKGMESLVDWFTLLSFDLHGPWDQYIDGLGNKIKPHTDLAEVEAAVNLITKSGVSSYKITMGTANYGRGFTIKDSKCRYYGCEFAGASKAGTCTKEDGLLSACEITRIIHEKRLQPSVIYGGAEAKEISWNDQWVSYDDKETLAKKRELANKHCLGGTALWALDYETCDG
jgi:GH18 family chitinase